MTDEDRIIAQQRLAILQAARDYADLLATPGWRRIEHVWTVWLEDARKDLVKIDTGDSQKALDALRRWQLAEKHFAFIVETINRTLQQAADIQGSQTLDDALMMESVYEQQSTANRPDPAGA